MEESEVCSLQMGFEGVSDSKEQLQKLTRKLKKISELKKREYRDGVKGEETR